MCGADCWTDHKLIHSKIQLQFCRKSKNRTSPGKVRYAVEKLSDPKVKESFQEKVKLWLDVKWKDAQDKWSVMRDGIIDSAEVVLGKSKNYKSDWFRESAVKLDPLIEEKQRSFRKLLNNRCSENIMKFKRARSSVQREIRKAKNDWIMDKAKQIEELESSGMGGAVWKVIRQMQQRRAGDYQLVVKNLNGELCQGVKELSERWREHFIKVLNVETDFDEATVRELDASNIREDLDRYPEYEEIKKAISRLKRGKAGGESGILPELVLDGGQALHSKLKDLMFLVWESERVPSDWCNAVIVPIPKKGDLLECDNWRGISMLEVVGKILPRVIQDRLQEIVEEEVLESQCGFRKRRGCVDMIFVVRQLAERVVEHCTKHFILFIDFQKAYDSVPRKALWIVLETYGVPERVISLIRSFHDGMMAKVLVNGSETEELGS